MTKWPTAWTLNGRFYRKNIGKTWKNHGENQGFLKMFHMNQAIHCDKVTRNARICKGNQVW
jgi:hypothetical protein